MAKSARKTPPPEPPSPPRPKWWRRRRYAVAAALAAVATGLAVVLIGRPLLEEIAPAKPQAVTDSDARLAPFYTAEVLYWRDDITRWAQQYHVNPNVLAIVIQIESCGDPAVISWAGALGLMQVMPFHFPNGENMIDPERNVRRGMGVFYECLTVFADWDVGLALACYNGGPSVTQRDYSAWAQETQDYYAWATGLWRDVAAGAETSDTLDDWLAAGGATLCRNAAADLFPDAGGTAPAAES